MDDLDSLRRENADLRARLAEVEEAEQRARARQRKALGLDNDLELVAKVILDHLRLSGVVLRHGTWTVGPGSHGGHFTPGDASE